MAVLARHGRVSLREVSVGSLPVELRLVTVGRTASRRK